MDNPILKYLQNPLIVASVASILIATQNYVEKLIFNHPHGDVNKYYLLRNFIISWGFMLFLIVLLYFEKRYLNFKNIMNTISYTQYLKNNYL